MIHGAFKRMQHDHWFADHPDGTLMKDHFAFRSPLGILGQLVDWAFITSYMRRFLVRRNETLKQMAEFDQWKRYLN
jgi:ligand-binding SRPBCC domain-containing protein